MTSSFTKTLQYLKQIVLVGGEFYRPNEEGRLVRTLQDIKEANDQLVIWENPSYQLEQLN